MSKLDGIKDFIEANKSSLENMNQEMKASYGRTPLVWLTVEEAQEVSALIHKLKDWIYTLSGGKWPDLDTEEECHEAFMLLVPQTEAKCSSE